MVSISLLSAAAGAVDEDASASGLLSLLAGGSGGWFGGCAEDMAERWEDYDGVR